MEEIQETKVLSPTRASQSAHRRPHSQPADTMTYSKLGRKAEEPDLSMPALVERHKFLLVTVVILVILCSVYLYFAVSMEIKNADLGYVGAACRGLKGELLQKCQEKLVAQGAKSHTAHSS